MPIIPGRPMDADALAIRWRHVEGLRAQAENLLMQVAERRGALERDAEAAGLGHVLSALDAPPRPAVEPEEALVRVRALGEFHAPYRHRTLSARPGDVLDVPASVAEALVASKHVEKVPAATPLHRVPPPVPAW